MSLTVKIRGDASQFEKTMRGVKGTIGGLSSRIAGIGVAAAGAAAGYITLSKAIEFVKSSSEKAASIEDLAMQFEVLTGSATKSAELLKAFREEEKKSALNTQDYANAAKTFIAFGGSLEDTLPSLRMLADVSMGNSERFASLALAFAQTTAAGRLMGQEVLQFVNAGFNPLEQISRDTGESMAVLKKRMEDGGISVQMVKQAFKNATSEGGRFFGAIDKGSATTNAKINQTEAAVTQLQVAFGTGFNEGLKDALDAANTFLPQLESKFTESGDLLGAAIGEAVSGDTKKFELIGNLVGALIMAGIKAAVIAGLNELGDKLGKGIAGAATSAPGVVGMVDQISGGKISSGIRESTRSQTTLGTQVGSAMDSPAVTAALEAVQAESRALQQQKQLEAFGQQFRDNFNATLVKPLLEVMSQRPQAAAEQAAQAAAAAFQQQAQQAANQGLPINATQQLIDAYAGVVKKERNAFFGSSFTN